MKTSLARRYSSTSVGRAIAAELEKPVVIHSRAADGDTAEALERTSGTVVLHCDHQPSAVISGTGASRDVPVSVIAKDPTVLDRTTSWSWQPGLRPGRDAVVWPMDTFRDKFFAAFETR